MTLTKKQATMLRDYCRDGEASDLGDFDGKLGWHNRERVIEALHRKGLLNEDGPTPLGIAEFKRAGGRLRPDNGEAFIG